MPWFEDEIKMINDDAFNVCKSHAMIAGIERKAKESELDKILAEFEKYSDASQENIETLKAKLQRLF